MRCIQAPWAPVCAATRVAVRLPRIGCSALSRARLTPCIDSMRVRTDIRPAIPSEQEPALGGRLGAQPGAILGVVATLRHSSTPVYGMQASAPRYQVVARAVMAEEAEQQAQSTPSSPLSNQPSAQPECSEFHSHDVLDIKFRLLQEIAGRHPLFCCCSTGRAVLVLSPPVLQACFRVHTDKEAPCGWTQHMQQVCEQSAC